MKKKLHGGEKGEKKKEPRSFFHAREKRIPSLTFSTKRDQMHVGEEAPLFSKEAARPLVTHGSKLVEREKGGGLPDFAGGVRKRSPLSTWRRAVGEKGGGKGYHFQENKGGKKTFSPRNPVGMKY